MCFCSGFGVQVLVQLWDSGSGVRDRAQGSGFEDMGLSLGMRDRVWFGLGLR